MGPNLTILLRVDGTWDRHGNFTSKYDTVMEVPVDTSFQEFLDLLKDKIVIDWNQNTVRLAYIVPCSPPPIVLNDVSEFLFFMKLKSFQNDASYLPLCVEVVPNFTFHPQTNNTTTHNAHKFNDEANGNIVLNSSILRNKYSTPQVIHGGILGDGSSSAHQNQVDNQHSFDPLPSSGSSCSMDVISHYHPTTIRCDGIYKSKDDLCRHLQMYAVTNSFQYRTKRSNRSSLHVVCSDADCPWTLRAVKLGNSHLFQIRRFDSSHSCAVDFREGDHRQATSSFVADLLLHRYVDATKKPYPPNDLREDMRREYGVTMSYRKALLVKQKALTKLYGSDEESYQLLPSMCYALDQKNPGSTIHFVRSDDQKFKYLFLCLAAWRQAWGNCFPVLIIDGTFMKAYYKGTLLTACCQDANKQIVPIAFGICDAEDKESWLWFLTQLKDTLPVRHDMYIMSDRHEGILYAVGKVFPNVGHGYCTEHLARNIRGKFKGPKEDLSWKFRKASRAATEVEREEYLQMLDDQDPRIRPYLWSIGESKWSRCKSGPYRYSVMTSNAAESMNNVNISAREYPVSKLVDFIRERMQKWFHERRERALSTTTILPKNLEDELISLQRDAFKMKVKPSCTYEFEIVDRWTRSFIVNLSDRTCTCGEFQLDHFVCVHAVAAIASRTGLSCYNFISPYYKRDSLVATYSGIMHPIGDKSLWNVPPDVASVICKPPSCNKRPPGRPKKRRLPSVGEYELGRRRRKQKCTRCLTLGHNKKTCKNPIPN